MEAKVLKLILKKEGLGCPIKEPTGVEDSGMDHSIPKIDFSS